MTRPRNNNNNQENTNKNTGRIDPLQIAVGLLDGAVGPILDNTDVRIGPDGIKVEVNEQTGQTGQTGLVRDTSEDCPGGGGSGNVGVRSGLGSCDCWEVGTDYPGGDLRTVANPRQVSSVSECQSACRDTPGCQHFSYRRKRGRPGRTNCWLKSSNSRQRSNSGRISGPKSCDISIEIAPVDPKPSSGCVTVGGGTTGAACVFPFLYKNKKHTSCTLVDADDGIPWCSTLTDSDGVHVGGQGKWGHCPDSCEADVDVNVVGSASNTELNKVPWIKNGALPSLPTGVLGAAAGVSQNDVKNKFFSLGLDQPNTQHQACPAIGNSQGHCRHFHHCLLPAFFNFFTFLSNICIIQGSFIGVCCPDTAATTQATTVVTTPTTVVTTPTTATTPVAPTRGKCGV